MEHDLNRCGGTYARWKKLKELIPPERKVEFNIKDPSVGLKLEHFTGITHTCWGKYNVNHRHKHRNRATS